MEKISFDEQNILKQKLAYAIQNSDINEIERISKILNIPEEQRKYFTKGLTGYPSIDKPWLSYYSEGAEERANNIPLDKTVWDVIEEKLLEYYDIPAIEYFKKQISRPEFRDLCYIWARTFRAMGVEEGEIVPVYGPFVPDICAMVFALNMIGACPYFLKLAIDEKSLEEETREAKIAVVYDGMWKNVAQEFSKPKFKNVIVATVTADMPSPTKEIVSFISGIKAKMNHLEIPDEKKYIWADKARDIANYYSGNVKVPFKSNRSAFITSSSGTTVGGVVKGIIATNESTISQLYMADASNVLYFLGEKVLNHFPPTASTSLNILFMLPLHRGMTVMLDPRVSDKDFYNQLTTLKPQLAVSTGSAWAVFFNKVENEMKQGKNFDFSFARGWVIGGEGTDVDKFLKYKQIMTLAGAPEAMASAYGLSEVFSAEATEKSNARYDFSKKIMSVGIPYAGINVGVFDKEGNELTYNQRGELKIQSKSAMKEYYNKPELTNEVKVDGWIKTGDLVEIDERGFQYVWGRVKDSIKLPGNIEVYLFDIANKIKENDFIDDAIVLSMPTEENDNNLVAHIVWKEETLLGNKKDYIDMMNQQLSNFLPSGIVVSAYSVHDTMLPYSSTTLKKDKNKMSEQTKNYVQVIDGKLNNIEFILNENGKYSRKCAIIEKYKVKTLFRK